MPENSMGTQKVSRLVLSTGIPLMLSLLINSLPMGLTLWQRESRAVFVG